MVDFSISLLYKQKGGPPLGTTSLGHTVSPPVPNRVKAEGQFVKPNKWPGKVMFVRLRLVYKRRKCGLSVHVGRESKGQLISKCLFGVFNSPKK